MGTGSVWLFGLGLFAAGLSSALTAPMAAGKVAASLWKHFYLSQKGLALWIEIMVVVAGAWVAISNVNNLWVIKVAQVINGTLLPVFITMILWLLNSRTVMHKIKTSPGSMLQGSSCFWSALYFHFKTLISILSLEKITHQHRLW